MAKPAAIQLCSYWNDETLEDDLRCEMQIENLPGGSERVTYRTAKRTVVFEGRSDAGWLYGKLNGRAAMGYRRNGRHTVFSTTDMGTTFETWQVGYEHGRYSAPRVPQREEPAVSCIFPDAPGKPVACHESEGLSPTVYSAGKHKVVVEAEKFGNGWWWGKLNGRPAMGYELNKGHEVFSTADFKTRFEYWYATYRNGSY